MSARHSRSATTYTSMVGSSSGSSSGPDGTKPRTAHESVVSQCQLIAPVRRANKAAESAAGKNVANGSPSAGAEVENDPPVAG
jgi:hypothetical protein